MPHEKSVVEEPPDRVVCSLGRLAGLIDLPRFMGDAIQSCQAEGESILAMTNSDPNVTVSVMLNGGGTELSIEAQDADPPSRGTVSSYRFGVESR